MSSAQLLGLSNIGNINAELLAGTYIIKHLLLAVADHQDNIADAVMRQRLYNELEYGLIRDGNHRFRSVNGKRP